MAIIDAYPKLYGARDAWQGWKNATLDKINALPNATKWFNYTDPLAKKGQDLKAALDDKFGPAPPLGWKAQYQHTVFDRAVAKVIPDAKQDDPVVAALNDKLAPYNIEVSAKMVMAPTKFQNMAAIVAAHFAGVALEATAIDFKPCLISHHVSGAMAGATLLNVQPNLVQVMNTGGMLWPQVKEKEREGGRGDGGCQRVDPPPPSLKPFLLLPLQALNLQPTLLFVSDMGANVQPQGMQVKDCAGGKTRDASARFCLCLAHADLPFFLHRSRPT